MILKPWEELPEALKTPSVKPYYDALSRRKGSLFVKRAFDVTAAGVMLAALSPLFLILAAAIRADSRGPIFFRQVRVTQYGKEFRIFKFRTMVVDAEKLGTQVTVGNDSRITKVGGFIRKFRLDEIPQLLNILSGEMSFVGTRPEVPRYVQKYTPEMWATLLLPAGVTSLASIRYKDEADLLNRAADADETYIREVLPGKMKYNLQALREFSFFGDLRLMLMTVGAVLSRGEREGEK